MVADIKSERWPASRRNGWPASVGIRTIPHAGQEYGVVTVSAGVMHLAGPTTRTPDEWFALADAALYEAKRQGRNQVRIQGANKSVSSSQTLLTPSGEAQPARLLP